jgi:large subunit ribosomal protein L21
MYAVICTGGKQYKVSEGQTVRVEKLPGAVGDSISFDRVLLYSDGDTVKVGQPTLDGMTVTGRIVQQGKAKKIIVFKYKRRKGYRRKQGHRQAFTALKIDNINAAQE